MIFAHPLCRPLVGLALLILAAGLPAGAQPTDLVLCLDTSNSMQNAVPGSLLSRWDIERNGVAAAVLDPTVIPHDGTIRLTVVQFSASAQVEVPPTVVDSASAPGIAMLVQGIQPFSLTTNPADCIDLAVDTLSAAPSFPGRKVIDVSTDGLPVPISGTGTAITAAQAAITAGFDAVNALGIVLGSAGIQFLEDLVQPQPAGGDEGFVVSVDDPLEYQQKLAEKIVRETQGSCGRVGDVDILCPDDGGDRFTLQLTVSNVSPDEIHHLFVVEDPAHPLPSGIVLLDDYFDLSAHPLCSPQTDPSCDPADARTTVEVEVRGQPGETFGLLVTLHNQDLSECCSISVPIELPPCDCAQVLDENLLCRFDFVGGQLVKRWTYDFTLQNLTDQTVEHVLMTPISPQEVTFSPPFFSSLGLAPVSTAGGGTSGPLQTVIGGAAAQVGQEVCFYLSTHTGSFDSCCAVQRCVTLPSCRLIGDPVRFGPIGSTDLQFLGGRLVVSGFGPGGQDGVVVSVPPAESLGLGFEPPEPQGPGYFLDLMSQGSLGGEADHPVVGLRAYDTAAGTRVVPRTRVGAVRTVELRRDGQTLETFSIRSGQGVTIPSRFACEEVIVLLEANEANVVIAWPRAVALRPDSADGVELMADEVIFRTDLRRDFDGLTQLRVRARAIPELVVDEVAFALVPVLEGISKRDRDATCLRRRPSSRAGAGGSRAPPPAIILHRILAPNPHRDSRR